MKTALLCLTLLSLVLSRDMCCLVCDKTPTTIKTVSVDTVFNHCGESCIEESYFWLYKIFESGLQKVDKRDAMACEDLGFTQFYQTVTHGIPYIFTVDVDLYNQPEQKKSSFLGQ